MPASPPLVYWDSCIFCDYFQRNPAWYAVLQSIVEDALRKNIKIVTSTLSIAEVAFVLNELETRRLDTSSLITLDDAWLDRSIILLIEFDPTIARRARDLVRRAFGEGRKLEASDAVHLATACSRNVSEFHTTDKALLGWDGEWFPVRTPFTSRPMLPLPPTT